MPNTNRLSPWLRQWLEARGTTWEIMRKYSRHLAALRKALRTYDVYAEVKAQAGLDALEIAHARNLAEKTSDVSQSKRG